MPLEENKAAQDSPERTGNSKLRRSLRAIFLALVAGLGTIALLNVAFLLIVFSLYPHPERRILGSTASGYVKLLNATGSGKGQQALIDHMLKKNGEGPTGEFAYLNMRRLDERYSRKMAVRRGVNDDLFMTIADRAGVPPSYQIRLYKVTKNGTISWRAGKVASATSPPSR